MKSNHIQILNLKHQNRCVEKLIINDVNSGNTGII